MNFQYFSFAVMKLNPDYLHQTQINPKLHYMCPYLLLMYLPAQYMGFFVHQGHTLCIEWLKYHSRGKNSLSYTKHSLRDKCESIPSFKRIFILYQDKLTTDKKPTVGYSIPDEIPTTCFQLCELV